MTLETILLFFLVIFFLVLAHEWGHYALARRFNITVEEFGIGFPPRLLSWKSRSRGTLFSLNAIPFGGFVRLKGEDVTDPAARAEAGSFAAAPRLAQAAVLAGGVAMNALVGWALYAAAYAQGILVSAESVPENAIVLSRSLVIADVLPESPAQYAGVRPGDVVVAVRPDGGDEIQRPSQEDFIAAIQNSQTVTLSLLRAGKPLSLTITPQDNLAESGKRAIGVVPIEAALIRVPWWRAPWEGLRHAAETTIAVFFGLSELVAQAISGNPQLESIAGPVGIAALIGEASEMGFSFFIPFVALISLNLAVLNLLPFPALDGGRLVILSIEALIRRSIPARVVQAINLAGFALLLFLAVVITYHDIVRLTS
ncbi:RIP metalloprotease RseP [Candidatus Parcubacteria bacterium]|nr:MAG: RIP metalloprotease RseP [Candidatus Parcubacteria bacterium]